MLLTTPQAGPMMIFARDMERDFFMSAEEAVSYGLADRVITKRDI